MRSTRSAQSKVTSPFDYMVIRLQNLYGIDECHHVTASQSGEGLKIRIAGLCIHIEARFILIDIDHNITLAFVQRMESCVVFP